MQNSNQECIFFLLRKEMAMIGTALNAIEEEKLSYVQLVLECIMKYVWVEISKHPILFALCVRYVSYWNCSEHCLLNFSIILNNIEAYNKANNIIFNSL